ncbi:hypothetical protein OIDMADRAFT_58972 [Oidiodendron maius Zn]|uniref:Transcription factor domain-containing protein n=1 Tax=Oidiodendron maius (strain Zn) TaxID=913774 RepID=A0A0C3H053_OIDMZ|nr:hypothetical protein OIDMADRAFT_58972 [Oidiodendron maius Zn]
MTSSTEPIASCNLPQPTEEMQNELGIGSASSIDRNRVKPDGTRRGKAKGKTRAFRVFEPLSRRFLNETDAREHLQQTTDLPLNAGQLDESESKFPQYEFLNLHGSHSYTEASRTAARAHVMRHVVKEKEARKAFLMKQLIPTSQRLNLSNHIAEDLYATNVSGSMMMTESRSEPLRSFAKASSNDTGYYYYHTSRELTTPHATGLTGNHIALGHLSNVEIAPKQSPSPLCTSILPFSTQRREVELIHHYIQVFAKSSLPMSSLDESQWFNKALNDEACYHGTLFVSAAHQALLAGAGNDLPRDCYRHKGEAIRIINQRLGDPHRRIEDGTIAAIACLAAYENVNGSLETAEVHVKGLESLGNLRGGFHSADMPVFLEQIVYWVELCNASALKRRARFIPQNLLNLMAPNLTVPDSPVFTAVWNRQWGFLGPEIVPFRLYDGMNILRATMFHRIRELSYIRAKVQSVGELATVSQQQFTNKVLLIERQINAIVNQPAADGKSSSMPMRCMPFYSSTLLFVYLVLRGIPTTSSILGNFITRLRTALSFLKRENNWQEIPHGFLLWMLFIGGWAAEGRQDRSWYSDHIAWLGTQMKLEFWEQAKNVISEYAYVDSICERPGRKLWGESKYRS